MSEAKDLYLATIDLVGDGKKAARKAALTRAHEIRQFEIELYWKRSNYFWLLQAAVFAAVGLTSATEKASFPEIIPVTLASLGVLASWAGYLATHGSKFWQRNWEHHIDMLETEFEGSLYKTVYVGPSGVKWSLSGMSESLALCFSIFWVLILLVISFWANPNWTGCPCDLSWPSSLLELLTLLSWGATLIGSIFLYSQGSGVKGDKKTYPGSFSMEDDKPGKAKFRSDPNAVPSLIRREPAIK